MDIILPAFSVCHTSGPEVEWAHERGGGQRNKRREGTFTTWLEKGQTSLQG